MFLYFIIIEIRTLVFLVFCLTLEQLQWELLKMGCQMSFCNSEQCFGTLK